MLPFPFDGTFKFKKLFPTSEYVLSPYLKDWSAAPLVVIEYEAGSLRTFFSQEGWTSAAKLTVSSGSEGETTLLKSPIMVAPALAGVEGKLQDRTGKPLAGLKVVASQKTAAKGYEKFETVVDPDGAFKFEKLLPESKYELKPIMQKISTGRQGETLKLEHPIEVRFTISDDGVIGDLVTGLEWYEGPDKNTAWDEASAWVNSLNVAGANWPEGPITPAHRSASWPKTTSTARSLQRIFATRWRTTCLCAILFTPALEPCFT